MAEGGSMNFTEFNKRFLGIDLHWYQEMMLNDMVDFTGRSMKIHSRNYMKTIIRNIQIAQAVVKGKDVVILCSSEEAAKQTFEDIVEFFEMVNKNG